MAASWTPEILWFLADQSRRFGDLKRDLRGVSAKVLTERLRELERRAVVRRSVMATSPPTVEYSLTELGRRFVPLVEQIATLGAALGGDSLPPAPVQVAHLTVLAAPLKPGRALRAEAAAGAVGRAK
jgi:DNA-binding HxlR family transcriptional regulator